MMIAYTRASSTPTCTSRWKSARDSGAPTILVDEFLKDAIEVDVDCVCDGKRAVIGGVMQHIEEAGIHSGDSTSVLPPYSLSPEIVLSIEEQTRMLALELGVVGLMNVQFAVKGGEVYVLEVNPRASRTVPFVSKATGRPLAKIAAKLMVGKTLDELGVSDASIPTSRRRERKRVSVREISGRRHASRARDAIDGRSDGHRRHVRARVRQSRCSQAADDLRAAKKTRVHQRQRRRQARSP